MTNRGPLAGPFGVFDISFIGFMTREILFLLLYLLRVCNIAVRGKRN